MDATYILAVLASIFLIAGGSRLATGGARRMQGRIWMLVGAIFAAVSAWLFLRV